MKSIISETGPSIIGYNRTMIDNEISATKSAYESAKANFNGTYQQFVDDFETAKEKKFAKEAAYSNLQSTTLSFNQAQKTATDSYANYLQILKNFTSLSPNDINYESAKANVNNALKVYQDAKSKADAAKSTNDKAQAKNQTAESEWEQACATLETSKNRVQTASDRAFDASINYGNALARSQLFSDQEASDDISRTIAQLKSEIIVSPSELKGLTLSNYNKLKTSGDTDADMRAALISIFNHYRYVESLISSKYTTFLKEDAESLYSWAAEIPYDHTKRKEASKAYSDAKDQEEFAIASLNEALDKYSNAYQNTDNQLLNIIREAKAQADQWDSYLSAAYAELNAKVTAKINEQRNSETTEKNIHTQNYPDENPNVTATEIAKELARYSIQVERIRTSGAGVVLSSIFIPELPPNTGKPLSLSQLLDVFASVSIMGKQFAKLLRYADSRINSFAKEIGQTDVDYYSRMRIAADAWARIKYGADSRYNTNVDEINQIAYVTATNTYKTYKNNINVVNKVIEEINKEIDTWNKTNQDLVNAINRLNPKIIQAINENYQNEVDTRTVLDYSDERPGTIIDQPKLTVRNPLEKIATIPKYSDLTDLKDPPEVDFNADPIEMPSDQEIKDFNAQIDRIITTLAPFLSRVEKALIDKLSSSNKSLDPSLLDPKKLYIREKVEVRDDLLKTVYDGTLSFVESFSRTLQAMSRSEEDRKSRLDLEERLNSSKKMIFTSQIPVEDPLQTKSIISNGISFTNTESEAKSAIVGKMINQVTQSEIFVHSVHNLYERVALQAGLEIAGTSPKNARTISEMGIPMKELLEEDGVNIFKLMDQENNIGIAAALIRSLIAELQDEESLAQSALHLIASTTSIDEETSPEIIQQAILELIRVQQLQLFSIALFIGSAAGISSNELASSLKQSDGEQNFNNVGKASGIPSHKMDQIMAGIGTSFASLATLFSSIGLSEQSQKSLLLLIGAHQSGVSLTEGVPGGKAFQDALIQNIQNQGIDLSAAAVGTSSFISNLQLQLLKKGTHSESSIQEAFLGETGDNSTLSASFSSASAIVSAKAIMEEIQRENSSFTSEIHSVLPSIAGVSQEQTSSLIAATLLGKSSLNESAALITLIQNQQNEGIDQASTADYITQVLLKTAPEAEKSSYQGQKETIKQQLQRPATLPKEIRELLREAFSSISTNFTSPEALHQFFSKSTYANEKMVNFNRIAVDYLLDPAKTIIREFSIITRSSADKLQQSPLMIGG